MDLSGINSSDPIFELLSPEQKAEIHQREAAQQVQKHQRSNAMRQLNVDYRKRFGLGEGSSDLNSDELMELPLADEVAWREAVKRRLGHVMDAATKPQMFEKEVLTDEEEMVEKVVVKDKTKRTADEREAEELKRQMRLKQSRNEAIKKNNALARRNPGAAPVKERVYASEKSSSGMSITGEEVSASSMHDLEEYEKELYEESDSIVVPDNAPIRRSRRIKPERSESMSILSSDYGPGSEYDEDLGQFGSSSEYVPGKKRTTEMNWGDRAYVDDGNEEDRKFISQKAKVKTKAEPKYVLKKRK